MTILLSVKPQQLVNILNRETIIVILKSQLPLNVPVYLYCITAKNRKEELTFQPFGMHHSPLFPYAHGSWCLNYGRVYSKHCAVNGKVVAKCVFNEIYWLENEWASERHSDGKFFYQDHFNKACIDRLEAWKYANGKDLYAYQISNVEIFDTPKELGEFYVLDKAITKHTHVDWYTPLTKAPKPWCYAEEMR